MKIIPVIDILHGQVVHAKQGQRDCYAPITSTLCQGSNPLDVVDGLIKLYPFDTLYIADLNAIQYGSIPSDYIKKIQQKHPQLTVWLDAGLTLEHIDWIDSFPNIHWIIGTENISRLDDFFALVSALEAKHRTSWTLSIDYMPLGYRGPKQLELDAALWPNQVICMTLANVGSHAGVDVRCIQSLLQRKNKNTHLYAAGGVRHVADLLHLQHIGVSGALVATCLHNQQLNHEEIASFMAP